jgi:RimJ/RimL family protein N-acetyltransferase
MTPAHLPLLHRLDADPEVMKFILGRARTPDEIDTFWRPRCADTSADAVGLGWWVGFYDENFLGWWDLSPGTEVDAGTVTEAQIVTEAEIGWRLVRAQWRRGFASEGARALLAHAFDTVGLQRVWAETMAVNAASRGVMRTIGMRHVQTQVRQWEYPLPGAGRGEAIYEITGDDRLWRTDDHASAPAD